MDVDVGKVLGLCAILEDLTCRVKSTVKVPYFVTRN